MRERDFVSGYDTNHFDYMRSVGPEIPPTESYVTIPPALYIRTPRRVEMLGSHFDIQDVWTIGFIRRTEDVREWEFDVLRNGQSVGEWASRIEYRGGRLRIFGSDGWRTWSGRTFI
jgi:hypothetical protein